MIRRATTKYRDPAGDGAEAKRSINTSYSTISCAEATQRLRLARLAHDADPSVAAIATSAICELRQRERLCALEVGGE